MKNYEANRNNFYFCTMINIMGLAKVKHAVVAKVTLYSFLNIRGTLLSR